MALLGHLPPRDGLRMCKALRGADMVILPPHGGIRFFKVLSGADLVFLNGCQHYSFSCLHILIDSPWHCSCAVFIPAKIISCIHILLASLLLFIHTRQDDNFCWYWVPSPMIFILRLVFTFSLIWLTIVLPWDTPVVLFFAIDVSHYSLTPL